MTVVAMEPRRCRLVSPLRLQPRFNSGGALGTVKLLPNVPSPPVPLTALGRIAAAASGDQIGAQGTATKSAWLDVIKGQGKSLTFVVMILPAIGAGPPLVFDGLPEASSGGIGGKIDEAEHIVIPVFGHHHGSSVAATLVSAHPWTQPSQFEST